MRLRGVVFLSSDVNTTHACHFHPAHLTFLLIKLVPKEKIK